MEKLARISMPIDIAGTPDDVVDFFIRVTRLKIEDLEGEIIGRNKQIEELKIISDASTNNELLVNQVAAIEQIVKLRLQSKKRFKVALMKLQKQGNKFLKFETTQNF